jgi:hypothetical protein
MRFSKILSVGAVAVLMSAACRKDDPAPAPPPGPVTRTSSEFSFRAMANSEQLGFHPKFYVNSSADSFSVSKFNYYISNIRLIRDDGFIFSEKNSYHLIRHVEGDEKFVVEGIPEGTYTRLEFLIGVDSLRNVSGVQSGALDPVHNMFWDWSTGYIFFKLEGSYETLDRPEKDEYGIHVGGFSGPDACLQSCTLALDSPLVAKIGRRSKIGILTTADEIFTGLREIGFKYYYDNVTEFRIFREVSENYRDMFSIEKVEN